MKKVFIVVYEGRFHSEMPKYIAYSSYESAKNFILDDYEKVWPGFIHGDFSVYKSPEKAREEFEENNSEVPYFARVVPLDVNN